MTPYCVNDLAVHALFPFHMDSDHRVRRWHQQQWMENQPENQANDNQHHVKDRRERLPVQEQSDRGYQHSEDVDHRGSPARISSDIAKLDLSACSRSAIACTAKG
jgi:hypothetical protein